MQIGGRLVGSCERISRIASVPPVEAPTAEGDLSSLATDFDAFSNYSSAEEQPQVCLSLLRRMCDKGWALEVGSIHEAQQAVNHPDLVMSRLALISKTRADGSVKHRLVWDLRRSGVNDHVRQGERIVLPRLGDVVADCFDLTRHSALAEVDDWLRGRGP